MPHEVTTSKGMATKFKSGTVLAPFIGVVSEIFDCTSYRLTTEDKIKVCREIIYLLLFPTATFWTILIYILLKNLNLGIIMFMITLEISLQQSLQKAAPFSLTDNTDHNTTHDLLSGIV